MHVSARQLSRPVVILQQHHQDGISDSVGCGGLNAVERGEAQPPSVTTHNVEEDGAVRFTCVVWLGARRGACGGGGRGDRGAD